MVNATVVVEPQMVFADLEGRCTTAGWLEAGRSATPIVPGEPEYAVFERSGERIVYTFNPVCRLRVLDLSGVADLRVLPDVPIIDAGLVEAWLAAPDEPTVLRGILAAAAVGATALTDAVGGHRGHPQRSIAESAARAYDTLLDAAQADALLAVEVLRDELAPLLHALASGPTRDVLAASLEPAAADYDRVFTTEVAGPARDAYAAAWAEAPRLGPAASRESRVECHVAPAGMLAGSNELSHDFPGGYRGIAGLLRPDRVWVAWKVIEPRRSAGTAYDGLVWIEDHWAWFPRPYRVLRHLAPAG